MREKHFPLLARKANSRIAAAFPEMRLASCCCALWHCVFDERHANHTSPSEKMRRCRRLAVQRTHGKGAHLAAAGRQHQLEVRPAVPAGLAHGGARSPAAHHHPAHRRGICRLLLRIPDATPAAIPGT